MAGKWNGKQCPECGKGTLHDSTRTEQAEYRGVAFTSEQPGAYCDNCGQGIVYVSPEIEGRWEHFRKAVDNAQANELAAIRARLSLTQEEASRLSGGGHNAFSRYERQEAQPVLGVLYLFRLLDRDPSALTFLLSSETVANVSYSLEVADFNHLNLVVTKAPEVNSPGNWSSWLVGGAITNFGKSSQPRRRSADHVSFKMIFRETPNPAAVPVARPRARLAR